MRAASSATSTRWSRPGRTATSPCTPRSGFRRGADRLRVPAHGALRHGDDAVDRGARRSSRRPPGAAVLQPGAAGRLRVRERRHRQARHLDRDDRRADRGPLLEGARGREPRPDQGPRLPVRDPFGPHDLDRRREDAAGQAADPRPLRERGGEGRDPVPARHHHRRRAPPEGDRDLDLGQLRGRPRHGEDARRRSPSTRST